MGLRGMLFRFRAQGSGFLVVEYHTKPTSSSKENSKGPGVVVRPHLKGSMLCCGNLELEFCKSEALLQLDS